VRIDLNNGWTALASGASKGVSVLSGQLDAGHATRKDQAEDDLKKQSCSRSRDGRATAHLVTQRGLKQRQIRRAAGVGRRLTSEKRPRDRGARAAVRG
jgi:hypothetical protein